jgi:hypothetical protein
MPSIHIPPLPLPIRPEALEFGDVSGVYQAVWHVSDTCAALPDRELARRGEDAHAHGPGLYGLICIRPHVADIPSIQAHEYAHLLVGPLLSSREWEHGPRWRKALAELGYPAEAAEWIGWGKDR